VLLYDYTRQKFGWTKNKFDDTIIPVLKQMEEKKSQKLLDTYFKTKASPQSIEQNLSKRVQKAVRKLNNEKEDEESPDREHKAKKIKICNVDQKLKKEKDTDKLSIPTHRSKESIEINVSHNKPVKSTIQEKCAREFIPQREKNKTYALLKKLYAIEVFKSKQSLAKTKKTKRIIRKIKMEAELSESDSN